MEKGVRACQMQTISDSFSLAVALEKAEEIKESNPKS